MTAGVQVHHATPAAVDDRREAFRLALWAVILAGLLFRLVPAIQSLVPSGAGGLSYAYVRDLLDSGLVPPLTVGYNGTIGFPYPFLAFELVAVIAGVTGIDPLALLRVLPAVVGGLSLVAFAGLAGELLRRGRPVLVATFVVAALPAGFQASVLGGGISTALATLLVIVAIHLAARAFRTGGPRAYLLWGAVVGLAQLAHPAGGPAAAVGSLFVLLAVGPSQVRITGAVTAGLVALVVAAPWWLRVLVGLGPGPLLSAGGNEQGLATGLVDLAAPLTWVGGLPLLVAALALGLLETAVHPRRILLALGGWTLVAFVLGKGSPVLAFVVPAALFAAAGLESFIARTWPGLRRMAPVAATNLRPVAWLVAATATAVAVAVPLAVPGIAGPGDRLRQPDLDAMGVARAEFDPGTQFLLVTGSEWQADEVSEWFPALTGAVSVVTPQGTGWFGPDGLGQTVEDHAAIQACADQGIACVDAWSAATHIPFDAIYVAGPGAASSQRPQSTIDELLGAEPTARGDCCAALRASVQADPDWEVVHDGAGALIAVPKEQTSTPTPSRPFPAPVTTTSHDVPASIDATGSTDVSAALNAFIESVPNGSRIVFQAGGTYRLDGRGIVLHDRHHLVLDGNGATLQVTTGGEMWLGGPINLDSQRRTSGPSSDIAIRNFTLVGSNTNETTVHNPGRGENQHGIGIWGASNVEVAGNRISRTYGDGVYVSGNDDTHASADSIWVHDNTIGYAGRNGIALLAATNTLIERNRFDNVGLHVLDIEPDWAYQLVADVTFRANRVGSYGHTDAYIGFLFASNGADGSTVRDVTITGNTVTGNPRAGYDGSPRGLNTYVTTARQGAITFTDNTSTRAAIGPVLYFANVDGVTVTGNRQPLLSGSLALFSNCTGVVRQ